MKHALISKSICGAVEPAVLQVANRLFILTSGRAGSVKRKPTISSFYETGIVSAIFEHLLMMPELAHLEIVHEKPYSHKTKPKQVDIWIRPPNGGYETLVEAGDFSPKKVKNDASKMRQLNPYGTNWFLAFFRSEPNSLDPWKKLNECRRRKGSLKGCRIELNQRMVDSFTIKLPHRSDVHFGFALIRINP